MALVMAPMLAPKARESARFPGCFRTQPARRWVRAWGTSEGGATPLLRPTPVSHLRCADGAADGVAPPSLVPFLDHE